MKRKDLEDLGLTKEQVDAVIKTNGEDVENAKRTLEDELKSYKKQVKERDDQLEQLKASTGDNEALKKQIEDLQSENTKAKETHEAELNGLKISYAVEKALTEANAKNVTAAKALLDLNNATLDKDGNVKGLKEQIEKLAADEGTKFMFEKSNSFRSYKPGGGKHEPDSGTDTSKMNYEELCTYLEANPGATLE